MGKKQYFPAVYVWHFESAHAALGRLGIVGADADFCLTGVEVNRERPVVFEVYLKDPEAKYSNNPVSRSNVVLMEREDGSIGLWFGMFEYLSDTFDGAQSAGIDYVLLTEGGGLQQHDEPPTLNVFEWAPPVRTLQ